MTRSRRRRVPALIALCAVAATVTTTPPAAAAYPGPGHVTGDVAAHDPSMVRTPDGYLLHSTHDRIQVRSSADRAHFTRTGSALREVPAWVYEYNSGGDVWAPDVSRHNGRYWMYYSASSFGTNHSAIGLATSPTGHPGTWTDRGIVLSSRAGDDYNAIDPALLVDRQGRWWLSFGSFWSGIRMIRLDPATGKASPLDDRLYHLAGRPNPPNAIESPYIVEHGGYYYLFVSFGRCCRGTDSTYRVMVGRSRSPTGPYLDRDGTPMRDGGGTEVLATHGDVVGPGGQSVLDDADGSLLVYHYYDAGADGAPRLGLNLLDWDAQGWPYVR